MFNRFAGISIPQLDSLTLTAFWIVILNMAFNILANVSFRISAMSATWRGILTWQVIGNLAGLITVITLTLLLRHMPLSIAFPLTTGLAVLGVQLVAAIWLFHEPISRQQWLGTLAIVIGIWLIQR
jgi:undecaprenyl phosphate-alpha-L-ara4N flippase subunit ArnE